MKNLNYTWMWAGHSGWCWQSVPHTQESHESRTPQPRKQCHFVLPTYSVAAAEVSLHSSQVGWDLVQSPYPQRARGRRNCSTLQIKPQSYPKWPVYGGPHSLPTQLQATRLALTWWDSRPAKDNLDQVLPLRSVQPDKHFQADCQSEDGPVEALDSIVPEFPVSGTAELPYVSVLPAVAYLLISTFHS